MADAMTALYEQIDNAETAWEVLGIRSRSITKAEIRDTYRSLALLLHPDKAQDEELREQHTQVFQKIQEAYEVCLSEIIHVKGGIPESEPAALPESLESLHARNVANKEALKAARAEALKFIQAEKEAMQAERDKKAYREARYEAKRPTILLNKDARPAERLWMFKELRRPNRKRAHHQRAGKRSHAQGLSTTCEEQSRNPDKPATGEEVEDEPAEPHFRYLPKAQRTLVDNWGPESGNDVSSRCNRSLMSGDTRRIACVALSHLEQLKNCAAAKTHERYMELVDNGEGSITAMVQAEFEAEEETDRQLEQMERQGIEGIGWDDEDEEEEEDGPRTYQLCLDDLIPAGLLGY
ncbi:uncharacterized protein MYCFIDRAFT_85131 [Pseudocercospora fijiensis CIRAD86]|uniref:J domain-containing protein n=1 Tax=Pseudocercospora fijiensis (strain CIRAD86) TaxID=383855 RepID=M2YI36_PSEFD|nr:uncharacterized protein MYCFIDRAFT_85131 [Pseudocercospora fijiensis CIRAD86]EME77430.1 hypothetical protein MYCFIDRAFT_85131 [Pseudocercospora fijiensis CIRAD86]